MLQTADVLIMYGSIIYWFHILHVFHKQHLTINNTQANTHLFKTIYLLTHLNKHFYAGNFYTLLRHQLFGALHIDWSDLFTLL
jgi:hypothetical protein